MEVLLVGGTGVISNAVVNEAVNQGINVTCINRGYNHGVAINPKVATMHFDIRNRKIAEMNLTGKYFDVVVDFICFNATQVRNSLELFHDKCHQYVFISTDSVYKLQKDGYYDETSPQSNPEWDYSYQKAECEVIVRRFCEEHHLIYTIVRPSITYGNTRIPYGFMPEYGYHGTLIERIKAGKPVVTWNKGRNIQTMMRVEDFAVGMVGLWKNEKAYNEDFNICGESYTWADVLDVVDEYLGIKSIREDVPVEYIIKSLPNRKGEFLIDRAEDHIVCNEKLKKTVPNFLINYNLKDGVYKTMHYYETHNYIFGMDYIYDGHIDRLLSHFSNCKTAHVNYLGRKRIRCYHDYVVGRYGNHLLIRPLIFSERVARKIYRLFKKLK